MRFALTSFLILVCSVLWAQKVDSLYFNLYTDSLKKGSWNYINVEGKLSNGRIVPLTSQQIHIKSNFGKMEGNSLWIDWDFKADSVWVEVELKENPSVKKNICLHVKKLDLQMNAPVQDTSLQQLNQRLQQKSKKKRTGN